MFITAAFIVDLSLFFIIDLHVSMRGGQIMQMPGFYFRPFYNFRSFHGISWSAECIQTWEVLILDLLLDYLHEQGHVDHAVFD